MGVVSRWYFLVLAVANASEWLAVLGVYNVQLPIYRQRDLSLPEHQYAYLSSQCFHGRFVVGHPRHPIGIVRHANASSSRIAADRSSPSRTATRSTARIPTSDTRTVSIGRPGTPLTLLGTVIRAEQRKRRGLVLVIHRRDTRPGMPADGTPTSSTQHSGAGQ